MFMNRVSQTLHEEHRATIALMERLEQFLARNRGEPPKTAEPGVDSFLGDLASGVKADTDRHFGFEEEHLFTHLAAVGDEMIGMHLTSEHNAMRPLGERIAALALEARGTGFTAEGWGEFRRLGAELCERMLAHVQKEEMALLPLLEETMDPDTDARLYQEYFDSM